MSIFSFRSGFALPSYRLWVCVVLFSFSRVSSSIDDFNVTLPRSFIFLFAYVRSANRSTCLVSVLRCFAATCFSFKRSHRFWYAKIYKKEKRSNLWCLYRSAIIVASLKQRIPAIFRLYRLESSVSFSFFSILGEKEGTFSFVLLSLFPTYSASQNWLPSEKWEMCLEHLGEPVKVSHRILLPPYFRPRKCSLLPRTDLALEITEKRKTRRKKGK